MDRRDLVLSESVIKKFLSELGLGFGQERQVLDDVNTLLLYRVVQDVRLVFKLQLH